MATFEAMSRSATTRPRRPSWRLTTSPTAMRPAGGSTTCSDSGRDLGRRAGENGLAAFGLRGERDLSGLDLPHVGGDGLAGEDDAGEPHLERLEPLRVVVAPRRQDGAPGVPVGAEPVQDGTVEAAHGRELRIGVQRIHVAREAIDERLLRERLVGDGLVGLALRRHVLRAARSAVAAEATLAAHEDRRRGAEEDLALVVDGLRA